MTQAFTFGKEHCDDHNVVFVADGWPVSAPATPNKLAISGLDGTIRYKGKAYGEKHFSGTLYLLDVEDRIITYNETLTRATELARWLSAESRERLVLDAMPDRFYLAEVEQEITVETIDWGNGSIQLSFVLQPFTYSLLESAAQAALSAGSRKALTLDVPGNLAAPIGCSIKAIGSVVNQVELSVAGKLLRFAGLNLRTNQTLEVYYDLAIGEVMQVWANGAPGIRFLQPESTVPFTAVPGRNEVLVLTSGASQVKLFTRGRWR